jgi:hypothetical protein
METVADPKRFEFDKPDGTPSQAVGLKAVMQAAARNVKVGRGAFVVTRGGQYHHPNLNRQRALIVVRECLRSIPIGSGVVVRDVDGEIAFHARRVATNPYKDPFRDARISPERIDAGVDYYVDGPVYALGDGLILNVGTPSHTSVFGNDLAVVQLVAGPFARHSYFFAEHYENAAGLHVGQRVTSETVLYHGNGSIEIGWSDGRGSMAWDIDNSIEGERTVWGQNFSDLLESVGCAPGLVLGRPLTMTLPPGWPTAF